MSFDKLKEFIALAKEEGVCALAYENGDEKFSVEFPGSHVPQGQMVYAPSEKMANSPAVIAPSNLVNITSPFVGTFYRSASPDSDAYVKLGEKVNPGKVLCIVEAMKIMNEIESEVAGEIVEICAENETYVEFGEVLFKVRPAK